MPRFDNRDVLFDAPETWEDRSVIAFEAPKPPGAPFATNVTLMRVESKVISLSTFATQQIASLAAGLPKFDLVSQRTTTFGGLAALELLYHWEPPAGALTQRITIFERDGKIWSFTASALRTAFEQNLHVFDRIAASLKFVKSPTPGATPSKPPPPRGW